jgi:hypothetical protein
MAAVRRLPHRDRLGRHLCQRVQARALQNFRKRWCYSTANHRIGTTWSNRFTIKPTIYSYFGSTWNDGGSTDSDACYSKHNGYAKGAHTAWGKVRLVHCALKFALCSNNYLTMGIIGYWDGSKTAYYKRS